MSSPTHTKTISPPPADHKPAICNPLVAPPSTGTTELSTDFSHPAMNAMRVAGGVHIPPVTGWPGLDRDADAAACDALVIAAAQAILTTCYEALRELSERSFQATPNGMATDAVGDAVSALEDIGSALSIAAVETDERENEALIALERP